jgi:uncharacterized membrane protein
MDPHDPHTGEWYAAVLAIAATVAAGIWKLIFNFRKDVRDDKSGEAHSSVIVELRREVERLAKMVDELSAKLEDEVARRRAVENENHDLRLRIAVLERMMEGQQG